MGERIQYSQMQQLSRREKKQILRLKVSGITLIGTALWKCQISAVQWLQKQSTSQKSLGNKLRTENSITLKNKSMVYPHQQLFFVLVSVSKKNLSVLGKHQKKAKGLSWMYGPLPQTGDWIWWTLVSKNIFMFKNSYKLNLCSVSQNGH